jgi:hypothetical protein
MFDHLVPVYREIDKTFVALRRKRFHLDPMLSAHVSQQTSIVGSAFKRHGSIMELALRQSLATSPDYQIWKEARFAISHAADNLVNSQSEEACRASRLPYSASISERARSIQIDMMSYCRPRVFLGAYEFKRGHGDHDSGKIRQMRRDLLATSLLLVSFGEQHGLRVEEAQVRIIFYYGKCSIRDPWALTATELDEHFKWPVRRDVDEANRYFRVKLDALLEGTFQDEPNTLLDLMAL